MLPVYITTALNQDIVDIFDNVLNETNSNGWNQLQMVSASLKKKYLLQISFSYFSHRLALEVRPSWTTQSAMASS